MVDRKTSFAIGLAFATVAGFAVLSAEPVPTVAEICQPGFSRQHRMTARESAAIKRSMLPRGHSAAEYELDHVVPLCLGGSNATSNLQLQPWDKARVKDELEIWACKAVCRGEIGLEKAKGMFHAD